MGGGVVDEPSLEELAIEKRMAIESIARCSNILQYCVTNPNKESSSELMLITCPDISVYLVDREWWDKWKRFVDYTGEHSGSAGSGENPGPITIGNIVNEKGKLYDSIISSDGVGKVDVVPLDLYSHLFARYGGRGLYCRLVFASGYYRPMLQAVNVFVTDVVGKWVKYRLHPQSTLGDLRDRAIMDQLKQGGFGLIEDPPKWTRGTHKVICPNEMCDKIQTILLIWLSEKENALRNLPEELIFQIIDVTTTEIFSEVKNSSNTTLQAAGIKDNHVIKMTSEFCLNAVEEEVSLAVIGKIPLYTADLASAVMKTRLEACRNLRRVLSMLNAPIQTVLETGAVPLLISFLNEDAYPTIQFEACSALYNIAKGNSGYTRFVVEHGAVPPLKRLLKSPDTNIVEQAVWALGEIASDSYQMRDYLLACETMSDLVEILTPDIKLSLERNVVRAISNLCFGKPRPDFKYLRIALNALAPLIHSKDTQTIVDLLWAISYISDGTNDQISIVVETGMLPLIAEKLSDPSEAVHTPALRIIGNIVTGDDYQTQLAIDAGVLPYLRNLLANSAKRRIRQDACWTISNITAGSETQVMAVYNAGILPQLYHIIDHDTNYTVKKEALWAISNASNSINICEVLFPEGVDKLMKMLVYTDKTITAVVLEGIYNLLKWSTKFPDKFEKFKEIADNYKELLQNLSHSSSKTRDLCKSPSKIGDQASRIINVLSGRDPDFDINI